MKFSSSVVFVLFTISIAPFAIADFDNIDTDNLLQFDFSFTPLTPTDSSPNNFYKLEVDNQGNIFVVQTDVHRILKFDSNGKFIFQFGTHGSGEGEMTQPRDIAIDSSGDLYVVDGGNQRVLKFNSAGDYLNTFGDSAFSYLPRLNMGGIHIDEEDNVFVANSGRIFKFNLDETLKDIYGQDGADKGEALFIMDMDIDSRGNLYASENNLDKILKFDENGNFLFEFGESVSGISEPGKFTSPVDVAVDSKGNVYVIDSFDDSLQIFDPQGNYVHRVGDSTDDTFYAPSGITIDNLDNLFIADTNHQLVQKFVLNPVDLFVEQPDNEAEEIPNTPQSITVEKEPEPTVPAIPSTTTETLDNTTKPIASFVDPSKDPQHYVDRYNNEENYRDWFDKNYPEYESIYEAVGLDEPITVPTLPIYPDYTPDQHRLLGIVDGVQSYQNTEYGFTIDFPSPLLFLIDFPSLSDYDDAEQIIQFGGYPPHSRIIIENLPDHANSIDDQKYLETLEKRSITFTDTVTNNLEPNSSTITSSEITSVDNHKAYQVIHETTYETETPEKISATQTVIITDIVNDDDILSIMIVNMQYETELDVSSLTMFAPKFTNEQLTAFLDSFRFTTEHLPKIYGNSDAGFEIILHDDWTVRDYSFVTNVGDLVEKPLDEYLHKSFDHLVSSARIFPDNSRHMPGVDSLNVDIGTKDDLFVNQSPAAFLASYQEHHYDLMNRLGAMSCDLILPQPHTVDGVKSFQSQISCNEADKDQFSKINYTLLLTKDHFVLIHFIERPAVDNSRYVDDISTMINSIKLNMVSEPEASTINKSSLSENDAELTSTPKSSEIRCGMGTEMVDGICVVSIDEEPSEELSEEPSFVENIFGFFKSLFK
ncbi:6-bladed beta-propeller [Nitrosopumilus sp.]|uniref:6-bladed beta-propeller n=1 Tax=Nitrosopumilus sp. TaxID=2024843 RepID=UPI003D112F79